MALLQTAGYPVVPYTVNDPAFVLGPRVIGVIDDNNVPFSRGRHLGTGAPDDTELILVDVGRNLW